MTPEQAASETVQVFVTALEKLGVLPAEGTTLYSPDDLSGLLRVGQQHARYATQKRGYGYLADLVENIPIARGGWKARGADIIANGVHEGPVTADSFRIVDENGAGVLITLDRARELRLIPNGLQTSGWRKLQFGRVEIVVPSRLNAVDAIELSYELRPLG